MSNHDALAAALEETATSGIALTGEPGGIPGAEPTRTSVLSAHAASSCPSSAGSVAVAERELREQGMPLDDCCEDGWIDDRGPPPEAPWESMEVERAFLAEALLILADAAPADRRHLQSLKASIVRAWQRYAEAAISAADGPPSTRLHACGVEVPDPGVAPPFAWSIATLDQMTVDDPLWSCTIMLLRESLLRNGLASITPRTGHHPAGRGWSRERSASLLAIGTLPLPFGGAARAFRRRFAQQLSSGSSSAIIENVFAANLLLSPAERASACWMPCLVGLDALRRNDRSYPGAPLLLHFISENARLQLSKLPTGIATTWLVGRDRYERCAAWLLALLYMRRGCTLYAWTSEVPPKSGCYLLAGIGAAGAVGDLPANCQGTADLIAEAQQNQALARASSLSGQGGSVTSTSNAAGRSITA